MPFNVNINPNVNPNPDATPTQPSTPAPVTPDAGAPAVRPGAAMSTPDVGKKAARSYLSEREKKEQKPKESLADRGHRIGLKLFDEGDRSDLAWAADGRRRREQEAATKQPPEPGMKSLGTVKKGSSPAAVMDAAPGPAPEPAPTPAPSAPVPNEPWLTSLGTVRAANSPAAAMSPDVDAVSARTAPDVTPEPVAPATAVPVPEPVQQEAATEAVPETPSPVRESFGDPLFNRVPGHDSFDQIAPAPDAESDLSIERIYASKETQKDIAHAVAGTRRSGSASHGVISGNTAVRIEEISMNAEMAVEMWRDPSSYLRVLLNEYLPYNPETGEGVDQSAMVDDPSVAVDAMMHLLNDHDVLCLVEKTVNDEATTHLRTLRAHLGPGTWVHPIVTPVMFNADFDGDKLKISVDPEVMKGAKGAIEFLLGTEGDVKIDKGFFAMPKWDGGVDGILARLREDFAGLNLDAAELSGLAKAIDESWSNPEEGFKSMMRWARKIAARHHDGMTADRVVGKILNDIYDTSRKIRRVTLIIDGVADEYGIVFKENAFPASPLSRFGPDVVPSMPANLKDVEAGLNLPKGTTEGKNLPFRIGAGWAKKGRISKLIEGIFGKHVDKKTVLDLIATAMSGVKDFDERTRAVSEIARRSIVEVVGFPPINDDAALAVWLDQFVTEYNRAAHVVNSAAGNVKLNMMFAPGENFYMPGIPKGPVKDRNAALRKQFSRVYGGVRMGKLFGEKCPRGYQYVTLNEYIHNNKAGGEFLGKDTDEFDTVDKFIGRLADMRTSFALLFNNELTDGINAQLVDGRLRLADIIQARKENREFIGPLRPGERQMDFDREMEYLVEAFHFLGPDMFTFLHLDSPAAFEMTELGRKFLEATTEDEVRGILFEAVAQYRFAPVKKWRDLYDQTDDVALKNRYALYYEAELDSIASSSNTWRVIVELYKDGRRSDGKDILEAVLFADIGGTMKETILNLNVQEHPLGHPYQQMYEIAADLYANPKGLHSKDRFMSNFGHSQLLDDVKDASHKIDSYGDVNWEHCKKSVEDAHAMHANDIKDFLNIIASDPASIVDFRAWMVTDAILTVLEKTFASSEKGQQEPASNYLYSAVCYLLNGGVWSDMAFGGDFTVGKIAIDRFWKSPWLLSKLLTDPKFSITVYDGKGEILLNRRVLLGKNPSKEAIWDFLRANPRAAMALRLTGQGNGITKGGIAHTTATASLANTISAVLENQKSADLVNQRATIKLVDKPGFSALIAMTIAASGTKRYQLRDEMTLNIPQVVEFLRGFGPSVSLDDVNDAVDKLFLAKFGQEKVDLINSVYEDGQAQDADVNDTAEDLHDEDEYQLGQIREEMKENIFKYATLLADKKMGVAPVERMPAERVADLFKLDDESTIRMYYDTVQTIGNVKTELSTSVNGAESRRNVALMFLSFITPNGCTAPKPVGQAAGEWAEHWENDIGKQALMSNNKLVPVNETTWEEIASDALKRSGQVFIEEPALCESLTCPCRRHANADQSTNFSGPHTPAFVRLLTVVRTLSAEKLNLKSKTQGSDGRDSVSKVLMIDIIDPKIDAKVQAAFERGGMPEARMALAKQLKKTFAKMGYDEQITMNDYVNVAHVMIRTLPAEVEGGPEQTKILAIGQINSMVEQALKDARSSGEITPKQAEEIAEMTLTDLNRITGTLDLATVLAGFKVHREKKMRPALLNERAGSIGRNMELVAELVQKTGVEPMTDKELDAVEDRMAQRFPLYFTKWMQWAGERPENFTAGDGRRYTYRIIGVAGLQVERNAESGKLELVDDSESVMAVGPRNAYIVDARSAVAVKAIAQGWRMGVNVIIDGQLTTDQWAAVYASTGIDASQGVEILGMRPDKRSPRAKGTLIPMFDIRLNGGNTTLVDGAFNAGSFWALPKYLYFYFESVVNEHSAGDGEFISYATFAKNLRHKKEGVYNIPANVAFANLLARSSSPQGDTTAKVPQGQGDVKLVIFGSRGFTDYDSLRRAIENTTMYKLGLISEIVSGNAPGADKLGERWARENGVPIKKMPAAWNDLTAPGARIKTKKHGGGEYNANAGHNRNIEMFEYATHGLGFWDGKSPGTKQMKYVFADARRDAERGKAGAVAKNLMMVNPGTGVVELNGEKLGRLENMKDEPVIEFGIPEVTVADSHQVGEDIIQPFMEGRMQDIPLDAGILIVDEGSRDEIRLNEAVQAFVARVEREGLNADGLLRTARPGEIIGFMRAQVGGEVRYHPIRPFEADNAGGAPATMKIEDASFDQDAMNIVVKWSHEGNMDGRQFKIFEDGNGSAKFMARPEGIPDEVLRNGVTLAGYIAKASTASRRLLMRRQQKMLTMVYMARIDNDGYNLAEVPGILPNSPDLRSAILTGKTSPQLWKDALPTEETKINFIADKELNDLMNYFAHRCVRYGIDPTIMFASRYGDKMNYEWFNYQLVLRGGQAYQSSLMRFFHLMNPELCPDGTQDTSEEETLFDKNLQVKRPVRDDNGVLLGYELVDLFGGFHYLDDHYTGNSAAGSTSTTYSLASLPALMAGGKRLSQRMLNLILDWANIDQAAVPSSARSANDPDSE